MPVPLHHESYLLPHRRNTITISYFSAVHMAVFCILIGMIASVKIKNLWIDTFYYCFQTWWNV